MNGWMGAPRLSIEEVEKSLDQEMENDPILEALHKHIQAVDIHGDGREVDQTKYVGEFYMMLQKHFPNRLHPEIIRIAFRLYNEKQYDIKGWRKTIDYIMNPAGWLYDCYKDAILIYKQTRYAKSAEEREQREKELLERAILASRRKPCDAV